MKQCISRIIQWIIHLWQTLKEYVCKRKKRHIYLDDVDNDSVDEIVIDINGREENKEIEKEEINNDK